jgi:7-cyano-7-deazaguanine synthase
MAMIQAEVQQAQEIYVGANAMDHIYPDCRPEFLKTFQSLMNVATKQACEGKIPQLIAPLLKWDKVEIVKQARLLNVPLEMTFSCYSPIENNPCFSCDACILRNQALES